MIDHHSASGTGIFLRQCPQLEGAYDRGAFAVQLSGMETELGVNVFNHKRPLDADQISILKHKLGPVMVGALRGLSYVFYYFNDGSFPIPAGIQKMIDDNPDIYLEGC